jgi:hypothetical protein
LTKILTKPNWESYRFENPLDEVPASGVGYQTVALIAGGHRKSGVFEMTPEAT